MTDKVAGSSMLSERVTIQRAVRTSDGAGGFTQAWGTLYTVWAAIEGQSGDELLRAERVQAQQQYKVRVRAAEVPDLRPSDRLVWGTMLLNIRALPVVARGQLWRELICEAGVGGSG